MAAGSLAGTVGPMSKKSTVSTPYTFDTLGEAIFGNLALGDGAPTPDVFLRSFRYLRGCDRLAGLDWVFPAFLSTFLIISPIFLAIFVSIVC